MVKSLVVLAGLATVTPAAAEHYRCRGNTILTGDFRMSALTVRGSGDNVTIDHRGRELGHLLKRGNRIQIEVDHAVVATYDGRDFKVRNKPPTSLANATSRFDGCAERVAMVLWAIEAVGRLPTVKRGPARNVTTPGGFGRGKKRPQSP